MNLSRKARNVYLILMIAFSVAIAVMVASIIKTRAYNEKRHRVSYSGTQLFSGERSETEDVGIIAQSRESTWTKVFDLNNEGLEEHNYRAYTVDYTVKNNTGDEVKDFAFTLTFHQSHIFLLSAWNGALEIHQFVNGNEIVDTIPDLREFVPENHPFETFTADGETMVSMQPEDYLRYIPSATVNAMEMPIEPMEATTPGIIMYAPMDEDIDNVDLVLEYSFNRHLSREPLFRVSIGLIVICLMALIITVVTSAQIRQYKERHERDNEIINEAIETFTGFIDAKDPYTNGHSKRVALYTRRIAEAMGYEGEELDRIYYVALLHDCGKIGVPDSILGKPGRLTDEEFQVIKSHTVRGGEILKAFKSLENVGEGALYHHEKYNGKGYPEGKSGKSIPLIARMICVADSYDAMNSDRCYRRKLTKEQIIAELEKEKGQQFDPEITEIALRLIRENQLEA